MDYLKLFMMPLIGALIGWWTNLFAIKLIFRPLRPIKVPFFGIEFQGLIPKRRYEISRNIGEALEKEILTIEDIMDKLISEESKTQIIAYISDMIADKVQDKMPIFLPNGVKNSLTAHIMQLVDNNANQIFDALKNMAVKKASEEVNLRDMVEDKINSLDLETLERLIIELSKKELKQIELLGGVIGFFVGVIQAMIYYFF